MSIWLDRGAFDRIGWSGFGWTGLGWAQSFEAPRARLFKTRLLLLPLALLFAAGVWLVMSGSRGGMTGSGTPTLAAAMVQSSDDPVPQAISYDPFTSEVIVPQQPTPLDRLKLSRQSWQRGGLGSKAQVSFKLRNGNDYAVKDVAIACAFKRKDGRHLTDRTRLVPGRMGMRSRRSVERMHIGFVNVNASKAKCALVSASRS
jgi:hypothetical protein